MIKDYNILLEDENSRLASYATKHDQTGDRKYKEKNHPYRLAFQRDKDRILHSSAFKRLQYKTQVFIYSVGENYRNRLTHTLEVAGIAKTIGQNLGLNSLLCETIALAHDLGHTPFGHSGQDKLNEIMKNHGGFEHNKQSIRIVELLEQRYPSFLGLNLCRETIKGLMKHGGNYEKGDIYLERKKEGPSLESCIVDFSDAIAYNSHDIDDGLEMNFLTLEELMDFDFWKKTYEKNKKNYPQISQKILQRMTIRSMINEMTQDLIQNTHNNLTKYNIKTKEDIEKKWKEKIHLVQYSSKMEKNVKLLKAFLMSSLYKHPNLVKLQKKSLEIMEYLFCYFLEYPKKTPEKYQKRIEIDGVHRVVCDYIAGMTDRFAESTFYLIKKNELDY